MGYITLNGKVVKVSKQKSASTAFTASEIISRKIDTSKKLKLKGVKGKNCNVTACQKPPAVYFNSVMKAWYCESCSKEINHYSRTIVEVPLCIYDPSCQFSDFDFGDVKPENESEAIRAFFDYVKKDIDNVKLLKLEAIAKTVTKNTYSEMGQCLFGELSDEFINTAEKKENE